MNSKRKLEKCIATTALTVVADAIVNAGRLNFALPDLTSMLTVLTILYQKTTTPKGEILLTLLIPTLRSPVAFIFLRLREVVIRLSFESDYGDIKNARLVEFGYTANFCCSKKGLGRTRFLFLNPLENMCKWGKEFFSEDLHDTSESSRRQYNVLMLAQEHCCVSGTHGEKSPPSPPPHCPLLSRTIQKKEEEKRIAEEQAAKDRSWKIPICYDDDEDNTIAITPVLPIEEPDNSLKPCPNSHSEVPEGIPDKMCDVPLCENTTPLNALNEHSEIVVNSDDDNSSSDDDSPYGEDIDYVDASSPDVEIVSLEVVEIVDPEAERIDDDILLTIKDDILREKLLNINLLIAKIDALRDNPTPSSEVVIKSTSTFPNLFLEETNTFDNSIPESETFRFNLEEISSGSPTTHSELSLPDYKAFYVDNDHFKERSSGSTTTHVDFSQYDSFIFDLSNDQFPPADRSDFNHEEFADELTHIMPLPELECFKFKIEPDPGDLTSIDLGIRKNASTTNVNVPLEDDQSSLFAYVVWIFLAFLTYPVVPPYLLSTGNEDTIFDPGISIYHSFMPDVSHRSGTFMKFNDFPDCEDSRARSFALHPQEFHILSFILGIRYPNLID
ncbi:hypothetical protein Tco_0053106 [Tanacetum coccineum]